MGSSTVVKSQAKHANQQPAVNATDCLCILHYLWRVLDGMPAKCGTYIPRWSSIAHLHLVTCRCSPLCRGFLAVRYALRCWDVMPALLHNVCRLVTLNFHVLSNHMTHLMRTTLDGPS